MGYHKNAPWTAVSRERLARRVIQDGVTVRAAAAELSVSVRTAAKWDRPLSAVWRGRPCRFAVRGRTQPAADKFFLTGKDCCPHRRCTKPYSPQTNGKAERFIQTALREWAYAKHWTNSQERNLHLGPGTTTTTAKDPILASTTSRPSAVPTPEQPLDLLQAPAN